MILRLLQSLGLATPPPGGPMPVVQRSSKWPALRAEHLRRFPTCAACGKDAGEVHHILPVHLYPELEESADNLMSMCSVCHLRMGHLGSWMAFNPYVRSDAWRWLDKVKNRPTKRLTWGPKK